MVKEIKIDVPSTLRQIPLRNYVKWMKILEKYKEDERDDETYLKLKMLQVFCGLSIDDTYKIPLMHFEGVVDHISTLFNNKHELVNRFEFTDVNNETYEFGLIPNLNNMTFGEFVDLDTYINDMDNMHKAMTVLFRPISNTVGDTYKIQEYQGSSKFADIMLDTPMDVVMGAIDFMYRLQNKLAKATLASTQEKAMVEMEQAYKQISEENMDGLPAFTLWLKKTQLKSMMQ